MSSTTRHVVCVWGKNIGRDELRWASVACNDLFVLILLKYACSKLVYIFDYFRSNEFKHEKKAKSWTMCVCVIFNRVTNSSTKFVSWNANSKLRCSCRRLYSSTLSPTIWLWKRCSAGGGSEFLEDQRTPIAKVTHKRGLAMKGTLHVTVKIT